jgi:hypothetical protein
VQGCLIDYSIKQTKSNEFLFFSALSVIFGNEIRVSENCCEGVVEVCGQGWVYYGKKGLFDVNYSLVYKAALVEDENEFSGFSKHMLCKSLLALS